MSMLPTNRPKKQTFTNPWDTKTEGSKATSQAPIFMTHASIDLLDSRRVRYKCLSIFMRGLIPRPTWRLRSDWG